MKKLCAYTVIACGIFLFGQSTEADAVSVDNAGEICINIEKMFRAAGSSRYGEYPFAFRVFYPAVALEFSLAAAEVEVISRSAVLALKADFLTSSEALSDLELFQTAIIGVSDHKGEKVFGAIGEKYG